jgi:hypothetical protein
MEAQAQAQVQACLPFRDGRGGWGVALDGGVAQARGGAREGAGFLVGRLATRERAVADASCWGGCGEERAPCYGTLWRRGGSKVQCGEGLGAAEEDTTTRVGKFSFFWRLVR